MSFSGSAQNALKHSPFVRGWIAVFAIFLAGAIVSCGSHGNHPAVVTHNAYITLPQAGSVRLLKLDDSTGAVTASTRPPRYGPIERHFIPLNCASLYGWAIAETARAAARTPAPSPH